MNSRKSKPLKVSPKSDDTFYGKLDFFVLLSRQALPTVTNQKILMSLKTSWEFRST